MLNVRALLFTFLDISYSSSHIGTVDGRSSILPERMSLFFFNFCSGSFTVCKSEAGNIKARKRLIHKQLCTINHHHFSSIGPVEACYKKQHFHCFRDLPKLLFTSGLIF
jgi:hypothetical protein